MELNDVIVVLNSSGRQDTPIASVGKSNYGVLFVKNNAYVLDSKGETVFHGTQEPDGLSLSEND